MKIVSYLEQRSLTLSSHTLLKLNDIRLIARKIKGLYVTEYWLTPLHPAHNAQHS